MNSRPFPVLGYIPHLCFVAAPWFVAVGLSWMVTVLGLAYLLGISKRNLPAISIAGLLTVLGVIPSPYLLPLGPVTLSALLVSLHLSMILVAPWLRVPLTPARNSWVLHASYFLFFVVFLAAGEDVFPKAAMQISLFTYASYISLYGRTIRVFLKDLWLLALLIVGSARSILAGFVFGRIAGLFSANSLRILTYLGIILVASVSIAYRDHLLAILTTGYEALKAAGYLLKGRTIFALALLKSTGTITLLGNGAGYTVHTMLASFDDQMQLHNDVLRTLFDYGLLPLLVLLSVLARRLLLGRRGFVVVAMFLAYMLTGNVLSYATVVFPLVLALGRHIGDAEIEDHPDGVLIPEATGGV